MSFASVFTTYKKGDFLFSNDIMEQIVVHELRYDWIEIDLCKCFFFLLLLANVERFLKVYGLAWMVWVM
jgi:hypothetical protein